MASSASSSAALAPRTLVPSCLAIRAAALLSGVFGSSAADWAGARVALRVRVAVLVRFATFTFGVALARAGFVAGFFAAGFGADLARARSRSAFPGSSRWTSRGLTSSRRPRKTGCRITPSRVHSANFTSATSSGFTQVGFSLACGGGPLNGGSLMMSGFISLSSWARVRSSNPPPVWPV